MFRDMASSLKAPPKQKTRKATQVALLKGLTWGMWSWKSTVNLKMCIAQAIFSKVVTGREEVKRLSHTELYTKRI
jgi:hypothetical protein